MKLVVYNKSIHICVTIKVKLLPYIKMYYFVETKFKKKKKKVVPINWDRGSIKHSEIVVSYELKQINDREKNGHKKNHEE